MVPMTMRTGDVIICHADLAARQRNIGLGQRIVQTAATTAVAPKVPLSRESNADGGVMGPEGPFEASGLAGLGLLMAAVPGGGAAVARPYQDGTKEAPGAL